MTLSPLWRVLTEVTKIEELHTSQIIVRNGNRTTHSFLTFFPSYSRDRKEKEDTVIKVETTNQSCPYSIYSLYIVPRN